MALIIAQFFRPERNLGNDVSRDISTVYPVPADVQQILKTSCYDCHSNHTEYPWYTNIQPVGWWLQHHINDGKHDLNFSEFASYRINKQYRRLEQTMELVQEGEMPLGSYTLIHRDAILDKAKQDILINWANSVRDTIKANNPADSLIMPKRRG